MAEGTEGIHEDQGEQGRENGPFDQGQIGGERLAVTEPRERNTGHERNHPRSRREAGPKRGHDFSTSRPYRKMMPGESAIPGSRATGATTSTITRDCDRPIDEGRRPREGPTMRPGRRV